MNKSEEQKKIEYKIKSIEEEIEENQKEYDRLEGNALGTTLIVFGIIGLFIFIIPGVILLIIAGSVSNNNKKEKVRIYSRIKELERQLVELKGIPDEKEGKQ